MKTLFALAFFIIPLIPLCQNFNYINYDTKDGLAGSTVYSMCQDRDGFIWFATENGLSRYDGTHFKNFTVKDGLPDNEVLLVYADSKSRIWIGTFSNQVCFYYGGKIYNSKNCDLIRKLDPSTNLESIAEDKNGYLGLGFRTRIAVITPTDSILKYTVEKISDKTGTEAGIYLYNGTMRVSINDITVYDFDNSSLQWLKKHNYGRPPRVFTDSASVSIKLDTINYKDSAVMIPGHLVSREFIGVTAKFVSTTDGAWSVNPVSLKLDRHFLAGKKISKTIEDREKNIWFSSLGEGVFKLPSQSIYTVSSPDARGTEIFSITNYQNTLLAGGEYSQAILVKENLKCKILNYANNLSFINRLIGGTNRLYSSASISDSTVILGYDGFLVKLENGKPFFKYLNPLKSVAQIDNDFIIAGTSFYTFKIRLSDLQITDTLWRERCTKVFYKDNRYYIGTLRGLYEVKEDKSYTYLGNLHPALTRRITDIKTGPSGLLWISTSDDGIVALRKREIIYHISDDDGLSSSICKTIFADSSNVWVGTNKGINKIVFRNARYFITQYSTSDGLPSDIINALYVKNGRLWVGSPAGLSFIDENNTPALSICNLKMLSVLVAGKEINADSTHYLSHKNNNIRFEFSGISFRSGNEITYWYKLNGLDNEWKQTQQNTLDYMSLPPGGYKLELYAINKYGVRSNTFVYGFFVTTPFWKTTWFYLLASTVVFSFILFFITRRNRRIRSELEKASRLQKQLAELEQQALQSQMNPHFIFNCLNSIQQYILTNEKEKANLYLTKFSSLIRQTLDISAEKTITVAEEISYLRKYLDMELMRFRNNFEYTIKTENIIAPDSLEIPGLLLQPFVENAVRHGIRLKDEGKGEILITFSLKENVLHCEIKDNGVGREKASEFKSKQHIEYQSRGMGLASKRINLLNTVNEKKILVTVLDLKSKENVAAGTSIEITMPV